MLLRSTFSFRDRILHLVHKNILFIERSRIRSRIVPARRTSVLPHSVLFPFFGLLSQRKRYGYDPLAKDKIISRTTIEHSTESSPGDHSERHVRATDRRSRAPVRRQSGRGVHVSTTSPRGNFNLKVLTPS